MDGLWDLVVFPADEGFFGVVGVAVCDGLLLLFFDFAFAVFLAEFLLGFLCFFFEVVPVFCGGFYGCDDEVDFFLVLFLEVLCVFFVVV